MAVIKAGTYTFAENLVMPTSDITFTLPTGSAKYQLNDNNNYGTASSPDYVCGYIKVYSSVKTAKGQNYFFETGNGSVWNRYATSWYCYNDGDIYTATDDTKLRIVEIASDMAVDDIAYNWFNSNIQRTLRESVEQHITDAYTAIGNKSGTIPTQKNLANLAGAIGTISTGVDTSDATATSADILKDKTAYVKGAKVTGAIETYDGTVEDVGGGGVEVTTEVSSTFGMSGYVDTEAFFKHAGVASETDYDFKIVSSGTSTTMYDKTGVVVSRYSFTTTLTNGPDVMGNYSGTDTIGVYVKRGAVQTVLVDGNIKDAVLANNTITITYSGLPSSKGSISIEVQFYD